MACGVCAHVCRHASSYWMAVSVFCCTNSSLFGVLPTNTLYSLCFRALFCSIIATDSLDWWYPANVQQHQLQGDWREHRTGRLLLCEGFGLQQRDKQSVLLEAFWHALSQTERHFTHLHSDPEHREGKMWMDTIVTPVLFVSACVLLAANGKPCSPHWGRAAVV